MYTILHIVDRQPQKCVYNFYPTFLPNYIIKTINDLGLLIIKHTKKPACKSVGKQLKEAVINHYRRKIKKNITQLKRKI